MKFFQIERACQLHRTEQKGNGGKENSTGIDGEEEIANNSRFRYE